MKFLGTIKAKKIGGKNNLTVEVWETGRSGTDSPTTLYLKYRGRWVSPYERQLRWHTGIPLGLLLLSRHYGPMLKEMIMADNPFLKMIKKDDGYNGKPIAIPLRYAPK